MLTLDGCRARQRRLLAEMEQRRWDVFLTGDFRATYYFTGALAPPDTPTAFWIRANGTSGLVSPVDTPAAADQRVKVETYSIERSIDYPVHDARKLLREMLGDTGTAPRRCGIQLASTPALFESVIRELPGCSIEDAGPTILRLRKRKEADEVAEIRESLDYCRIAYDKALEVIRPGLSEIDVHNALFDALTRKAGTTIPFPGDFACGLRCVRGGGPPTTRVVEAGDLYILDLFPAPHLYFGDTCRTFPVGQPSPKQMDAWRAVADAVVVGEEAVKPGVPAREVYSAVKKFLDRHDPSGSFFHHAGHGIGYHGHEAPRIIPGSDDVFEAGDVFTLEPGIYSDELRGGIRLEDNYLLMGDGIENLFPYPRNLGWTSR